jgi:hypothetical protein
VAFDILSHTDNTRHDLILQARWAVQDCEREFGCVEVLGYIVMCQDRREDTDHEIRKIVWRFEVEELRGSIASVNLSARPFTDYRCSMSSLNGNGIGFSGSSVSVQGVELGTFGSA